MSELFVPRVGGVLSADIAVPERDRVVRFYARVLGTGQDPLWRGDLMNNLGIPIIGLGERTGEHERLPVQWMPHIQVADVAASVARALETGGTELMHARDDDGGSQWAVLLDPHGAAFGMIPVIPVEALPPAGAAVSGDDDPRVGRVAWVDLTVPDAPGARDFYARVIGWSVEEVAMADDGERYVDYNMLGGDGVPAAGICHARGVNQGVPPVWLLYLPVADLAESLRRVEAEGGRILKATPGAGGGHASAVIQDPAGASVALVPG
jgi:uncharacterized protein